MFRLLAAMAVVLSSGAFAQPGYGSRITLAAPVAKPIKIVAGGAMWQCVGVTCRGPGVSGRYARGNACREIANALGAVSSFDVSGTSMDQPDISRCNTRAKAAR